MSDILDFVVPLVPPSVNHYAKHTRTGRHYVTGEAEAFKQAVAVYSRGRGIVGKSFAVKLVVVLGKGDRGDVDNFPKLILDGLAAAGVFLNKKLKPLTDAHVDRLEVRRDKTIRPEQGWTDVLVYAID